MNEILESAALVAAYVGVSKAFGVTDKWTHPAALLIAAVLVLVPPAIHDKIVEISLIGLTATGAYAYVKKREAKK